MPDDNFLTDDQVLNRVLDRVDNTIRVEFDSTATINAQLDSTTGLLLANLTEGSGRGYTSGLVTTNNFADTTVSLTFDPHSLTFENDGVGDLFVSFDGSNIHLRVKPGQSKTGDFRYESAIWFRHNAGDNTAVAHVEAW